MAAHRTGEAVRLSASPVTAVVSPRAASLRALRVGDRDLVEPTTGALDPPGMAGAVLVPWPNRVEAARWVYEGREQRLAVTDPELGHANHGLLAASDFDVRSVGPDSVVLECPIGGHEGYPFDLLVTVTYRLRADGVDAETAFMNRGGRTAPVAAGAHPYLRVGAVPTERLTVRLDAESARIPGPDLIPGESFDVEGTAYDLRKPTPFAEVPKHVTYERQGFSPSRHRVAAPDGTAVELRADEHHRWFQLYVAESLHTDDGPARAIAIEPMTAPPNALRTGEGLRWLEPGERWAPNWGIRLVG